MIDGPGGVPVSQKWFSTTNKRVNRPRLLGGSLGFIVLCSSAVLGRQGRFRFILSGTVYIA